MSNISINPKQTKVLKGIVKNGGRVDIVVANLDLRTINALASRDLVKKIESAKGIFVTATAKGKKFIN